MKKLLSLIIIPFLSFGQIVTEDCNSIPNPGICFAAIQIYYFEQNTGLCEESIWGGCGGLVPFWSLEECQNNCENTEVGGCMDSTACNYNELATEDWGNCLYPGDLCEGFDQQIQEFVYGYLEENCECALPLSIELFLTNKEIIKKSMLFSKKSTKKQ